MDAVAVFKSRADPKKLSKAVFFFAVYSFTGSTLMGSSVGLVIYQSHQLLWLNRLTCTDVIHPHMHHHHHPHHTMSHTAPLHDGAGDHPCPHHLQYHHNHNLRSLLFSTWLPILVWMVSLFGSSMLIEFRKWVPKVISARTGILISQCIFVIFWVLLGAIQEVQERLIAQGRAAFEVKPEMEAIGTSQMDGLFEMKSQARTMMAPLRTVWYLAVILLSVATGLMTTSCSLLNMQLHKELEDAHLEEQQHGEKKNSSTAEKIHQDQTLSIMDSKQSSSSATTTTITEAAAPCATKMTTPRYIHGQRAILCLMVLMLLWGQISVFQWVISSQSPTSSFSGTTTSVSTNLTLVGLLTGSVMFTLGVLFLPRSVC